MRLQRGAYHARVGGVVQEARMPRKKPPIQPNGEAFGKRMARLRQEAGYTQRELAVELGISHRMVAYYEGETDQPPAGLLPALAKILGVTTDDLLGATASKAQPRAQDNRLWRRLRQVEKLPAPERRQIVQLIDTFLERESLRKKQA